MERTAENFMAPAPCIAAMARGAGALSVDRMLAPAFLLPALRIPDYIIH
jgi:hypothetical protein